MYRIKESLYRFMLGRYGTDSLNKFIFILEMVLLAVYMFWRNIFLFFVIWLLIILYTFRSFSRNTEKRREENRKYLYFINKIAAFFKLQKSKWKDRKAYVYRKCGNCKAVVRLPRKKGKHIVCCPKCRKDFGVKVLF